MLAVQDYEGIIDGQQRSIAKSRMHPTTSRLHFHGMIEQMDKVQAHDDETQQSGSGSQYSDLSALENETDDFGRRILQHQRDAQQLNSALQEELQAFRKGRVKPRIVAETRVLAENNAILQATTIKSRSWEPEPPVTIPREWGRKARRQPGWMRKIRDPSEPNMNQHAIETFEPANGDAHMRKPVNAGDGNLAADTPSSMQHMNTTIGESLKDEDDDFNAGSFLASTPAASRLPRRTDEFTQREIETVERRGVASRALGQIDERSPNGTLRRVSSSRLRERAIADGMTSHLPRPDPVPDLPSSAGLSRIPRRMASPTRNKENLPPGYMKSEGRRMESAERTNNTSQHNISRKIERPEYNRADSMGLLKKLARVSSMSPSPARDNKLVPERKAAAGTKVESGIGAATSKEDETSRDHEGAQLHRRLEALRAVKLPDKPLCDDGEHKKFIDDGEIDVTRLPGHVQNELNTPVVTGAWVDTNIEHKDEDSIVVSRHHSDSTKTDARPSSQSGSSKEDSIEKESQQHIKRASSARPKSALEAIVREARTHDTAYHYGESTIQSLEDIVHPNLEPSDPTITFDLDALQKQQDEEYLYRGLALTKPEKEQRQESLAMEAMNKHLKNARTSIKDASRGLRRVENRMETAQENPAGTETAAANVSVNKTDTYTHCPTCGHVSQSVWGALWTEFSSLFYTCGQKSHGGWPRVRFTWLGLACLLWLTWLLSEITLCSYYCHRLYAASMVGYGADPDAPEFPFVIPTLVFRPLRWLWEPVCEAIAGLLVVMFHSFFGDSSTSPDPPPTAAAAKTGNFVRGTLGKAFATTTGREWVATATQATTRVAMSVVDAVDDVGSMWDDEAVW